MRLNEAIEATLLEEGHVMRILDPKEGDIKVIWDPDNADEVAHARTTFDAMQAKGFVAYSVTKKGDRDEIVRKFDPEAKALILAPKAVGG